MRNRQWRQIRRNTKTNRKEEEGRKKKKKNSTKTQQKLNKNSTKRIAKSKRTFDDAFHTEVVLSRRERKALTMRLNFKK
jgi:hypothetical protein